MTLAYLGRKVPLAQLREALGTGLEGSSVQSLVEVARQFRLRARAVHIEDVRLLPQLAPGSILHWRFTHFVVLQGSNRRGITVLDPARGSVEISAAEATREFTGVAIIFDVGEDFQPGETSSDRDLIVSYLKPLLAKKGSLLRIAALSILLQILALATPLLTGMVVDQVVPSENRDLLQMLAIVLLAVVFFEVLSDLTRANVLLNLRNQVDTDLAFRFVDHLIHLPYMFFQTRSTGDLMLRLQSNSAIREMLTSGVLSTLVDGLFTLSYIALLLSLHLTFGLVVLGLGALRVVLFFAVRRRQRELVAEEIQAQADSRGFQVEMLSGIETIKSTGIENKVLDQWLRRFSDELDATLRKGRLDALFESLMRALRSGSPMLLICLGAVWVLDGELSLGSMLAMTSLGVGALTPLSALVSTALRLELLKGYLERIGDVITANREDRAVQQARPGEPRLASESIRGRIELVDVSYRYSRNAPPVLRGVSLDISAGSFVAVVGASGSGKSTLARILAGLVTPDAGKVLIDGIVLDDSQKIELRKAAGIVPQEPYLFGGTILSNICLSSEEITTDEAIRAGKIVDIHDEILMCIPTHCGHRFRWKPATDSDGSRPPIPMEAGHRFRRKPATDSDGSRPPSRRHRFGCREVG